MKWNMTLLECHIQQTGFYSFTPAQHKGI